MGTGSPYRTPGAVHTFGAARDTDRRNHREPRPREPPRRRRRRRPLRRRGDRHAAGPRRATTSCWSTAHGCPSDTNSTHSLVRGGVVQLSRWGLLDEVLATGAPAIRSVSFHQYGPAAPAPVRLPVKDKAGVDHMLAPRRLRPRPDPRRRRGPGRRHPAGPGRPSTASSVTTGGRVRGVTATRRRTGPGCGSRHGSWSAPTACGRGSRRLVGAEVVERHAPSGACLYTYVGDVPWDGFEFHLGDHAFARRVPDPPRRGLRVADPPARTSRSPCSRRAPTASRPGLEALESTAPELAERVRRRHGHRAAARRGRACPTTCAGRPGRAGRWSATPATTATRSPGTA